MRKSLGKEIADQLDRQRADAREANKALRLQVRAWRVCAIIATVDPKRGVKVARWLFMVSVPFVNDRDIQEFLDREERKAEEYGKRSGVFN